MFASLKDLLQNDDQWAEWNLNQKYVPLPFNVKKQRLAVHPRVAQLVLRGLQLQVFAWLQPVASWVAALDEVQPWLSSEVAQRWACVELGSRQAHPQSVALGLPMSKLEVLSSQVGKWIPRSQTLHTVAQNWRRTFHWAIAETSSAAMAALRRCPRFSWTPGSFSLWRRWKQNGPSFLAPKSLLSREAWACSQGFVHLKNYNLGLDENITKQKNNHPSSRGTWKVSGPSLLKTCTACSSWWHLVGVATNPSNLPCERQCPPSR